MNGSEIIYCMKESLIMLFTPQGIIAWSSVSMLVGVFVLAMKGKRSLLKVLIPLLVQSFAVCYGMMLLILAYAGNSKELFYVGFFIMVIPILITEIIGLIGKRINKALYKDI